VLSGVLFSGLAVEVSRTWVFSGLTADLGVEVEEAWFAISVSCNRHKISNNQFQLCDVSTANSYRTPMHKSWAISRINLTINSIQAVKH